jgi:uncharacterized protein (TIGR02268 family)
LPLLLALASLPCAALAAGPRKEPPRRELRHRVVTIDDASATALPEIHVAGGTPTILSFEGPLKPGGAILADVTDLFLPLQQLGRAVIVVPKADLAPGRPVPMTVSLEDGSILTFKLVSVPAEADVQVEVVVKLVARAPVDSALALRSSVAELRGELDQCRASGGAAGVAKLASLVLEDPLGAPRPLERHKVHRMDRQNRLLVEVRAAYRILGLTYLVLTVENRDASKPWVLDRAAVSVENAGGTAELKVQSFLTERESLPPAGAESEGKVVVVFSPPSSQAGERERVTLSLFERGGARNVKLEGIDL